MKKEKINKITEILSRMPEDKFPMVFNFVYWAKEADDMLNLDEVEGIRQARAEKSSISWEKLKDNG